MENKEANMSKNTNKTKNEIRIEVDKSVLKKIIKSHKNFASFDNGSTLSCLHFELADNKLEVATTDGNRMLVSTIEINNPEHKICNFNIQAGLLAKLVFFKGGVANSFEVIISKDSVCFNDIEHGFRQEFRIFGGTYPKYKQLFPEYAENEQFSIGLNSQFFKDLSLLNPNERTNIIVFNFNKENNLKPVLVNTGSPELQQSALLIPVQIR